MFRNLFSIITLLLLFSISGSAQKSGYLYGYIVTEDGDTIGGQLKEMSLPRSCAYFKFTDMNGEKVKVNHEKVVAYRRGAEFYYRKPYHPTKIGPNERYMRLIEDGKVQLFRYDYFTEDGTNVQLPGGVLLGKGSPSKDFYLERGGQLTLVKRSKFKETMAHYFSYHKELSDKIKNKKLRYRDLSKIVREYNEFYGDD